MVYTLGYLNRFGPRLIGNPLFPERECKPIFYIDPDLNPVVGTDGRIGLQHDAQLTLVWQS